jgi:pimeloyl-ACP methyl ester carboxylesterase
MMSRWARLATGCKAHYMTSGETGPAVILMHGGLMGASGTGSWRFMAPFLGANGFRVYCPDFPGFGLTEQYENVYPPDLSGHVDFLHDFTTALCIDKFHAAGNSMGCQNTVNYVTAYPKQILSFVLISGMIEDIVSLGEVMARLPTPPSREALVFQFDGTRESMAKMMGHIVTNTDTTTDDLVDMRTLAANKHLEYFKAMNEHPVFSSPDPDVRCRMRTKGRFDELSVPGIYLYGAADAMMPPEAGGHPQEDALTKMQFFYVPGAGHQGQTDQPDLFNQVFLEFFRDGKVSWQTAQLAGISTRRPPNPGVVAVPENAAR